MTNNVFRKGLVIGIIVLFIGMSVISGTSLNFKNKEICPKWRQLYRDPFFPSGFYPNFEFTYRIGQYVQQTTDKGYIVTGFKGEIDLADPNSDIYFNTLLIKYDENGNKEWNKTFDLMDGNMGNSVQQTENQGFIIGGSIISSNKSYAMIFKINEQGNEEWIKSYEGLGFAQGTVVKQTNDSGYILTGSSKPLNNSDITYMLLLKTDINGNEEWNKTFEYMDSSVGSSVQQTEDQGYIICGSMTSSDDINPCVLLVKTDKNGNEEWNKTFEFMKINMGYSVQQTEDQGYIICGYTKSSDYLKSYALLLKTDENGNEEWHKTFSDKYGYSVQQTEDKGYIIGGTAISSYKSYALLLKTDEQGNEEWVKTYAGLGYTQGNMVQQTVDKGYILTGYTLGSIFPTKTYVLLLKTDEEGNLEWISNLTKNTSTTNPINSLIVRLLERFPNAFPMLRYILGLQ